MRDTATLCTHPYEDVAPNDMACPARAKPSGSNATEDGSTVHDANKHTYPCYTTSEHLACAGLLSVENSGQSTRTGRNNTRFDAVNL